LWALWVPSLSAQSGRSEAAAKSFVLTIGSASGSYRSGEKIVIKTTVKNVGDQALPFRYENPLQFCFRFQIVRISGVSSGIAALTEFGKEQLTTAHNIWGIKGFQMQPGQEFSAEMPVSDFYDMTPPGSYRIICFIQPELFPKAPQKPWLTSKELVITVAQ
jgi:hypothetical protein